MSLEAVVAATAAAEAIPTATAVANISIAGVGVAAAAAVIELLVKVVAVVSRFAPRYPYMNEKKNLCQSAESVVHARCVSPLKPGSEGSYFSGQMIVNYPVH